MTTGQELSRCGLVALFTNVQHTDIITAALQFFWIKGHGGLPGNVDADKLADKAARLPDVPSRDIKADLEAYRAKLAKAEEEAKTKAQARNAKRSQALRQRRRRLA